ncbi:MAG: molybdopterin biosynthesis protein [Deltaproteobacteria bacterium RBG_13_52_11]|nr:MAG: molybdopterin biosynthesis protein [Deltaproteobacteria bacterium RBG_13_52_11]
MKRRIYLRMQSWEEALEAFFERVLPSRYNEIEILPVKEALGRVTAEPIFARLSSPHYHSAAMDGIALTAQVTFGAAEDRPKRLRVGEEAFFVDTGDPLPPRTDAVVMIEEVHQVDTQTVEIMRAASPWQHVRMVGEDLVASELILPQGHRLTPPDLGALLAGGILEVPVKKRPRVAVIPTGDEVVSPEEAFARGPQAGEIVDVNSTILGGLIEEAGGEFVPRPIVRDDPRELKDAILSASRKGYDVVVINAGSSAGSEDYTPAIVEELGEVLVHGVAVMPGKPTLLGVVNERPIIGIPGYPVSAVISFDLFVKPLLAAMLGRSAPKRESITVVPTRRLPSKLGAEEFVHVRVGQVGERVMAIPLPRGAGVISSLTRADAIIRIPRLLEGIEEGGEAAAELLVDKGEIANTVVIIGSHDLALDLLASWVKREVPFLRLSSNHVGSLEGIIALKKGYAHMAGSHLLDPSTGEYNLSYIQRYLSGVPVRVIHLAYRQQGFILPLGNPQGIKGLLDLVRDEVRFINRQRGSGTRVLLDHLLDQEGINPTQISGYEGEELTHLGVAVAIESGRADVGLGIYGAAKALGLHFVPLAQEQYDLIVPHEHFDDPRVQKVLAVLRSEGFRAQIEGLGGYNTSMMGKEISV